MWLSLRGDIWGAAGRTGQAGINSRRAAGDAPLPAMGQAVLGVSEFDQHGGFKSIMCQGRKLTDESLAT